MNFIHLKKYIRNEYARYKLNKNVGSTSNKNVDCKAMYENESEDLDINSKILNIKD